MNASDQLILTAEQMAVLSRVFRAGRAYGWAYPWHRTERKKARRQSDKAFKELMARGILKSLGEEDVVLDRNYRDLLRTCCKPDAYISASLAQDGGEQSLTYTCDKTGAARIVQRGSDVFIDGYAGREEVRTAFMALVKCAEPPSVACTLSKDEFSRVMAGKTADDRTNCLPILCKYGLSGVQAQSCLDALYRPDYRLTIVTECYDPALYDSAVVVGFSGVYWEISRYIGLQKLDGARLRVFDAPKMNRKIEDLVGVLYAEDPTKKPPA